MTEAIHTWPDIAQPFQLPFFYGALHNVGVDFLVDAGFAESVLKRRHPQLQAALFDGQACVSINYQLYFAQYASGGGVTQEVEINIVALPRGAAHRVGELSYADYARGLEQTKLLGIGRMFVLCDNLIAIDAGVKLFAEPKSFATFTVDMPSPNGPATQAWAITCHQPGRYPDARSDEGEQVDLFTLHASTAGLSPVAVENTPITGYGTDGQQRLIAGPMHVHDFYQYYALTPETDSAVDMVVHDWRSPVGSCLDELIGACPAVGMWTYQSSPVATHNRPYFVPVVDNLAVAKTAAMQQEIW